MAAGSRPYLAILVIDHDIVWFDIPVHNTLAVTEVESFEELENVVADIEIVELRV